MKFLIVGLGNIGQKYETTRHNVGFMVIDALAQRYGGAVFTEKFKGLITNTNIIDQNFLLLKPTTYMNLSGQSVAEVANFYKIPLSKIIVVYDDIDLECGRVKFKMGGGSGGHNGIKSIDQYLGENYWRLRIGISRPEHQEISDYVLSPFTKEQKGIIDSVITHLIENLPTLFSDGREMFLQKMTKI